MYARAHPVSPFSSVPTVGPSTTTYVSSTATEIVRIKPQVDDSTTSLPATSRHRPITNTSNPNPLLQQPSTAFIGEFTFPGEVASSSPTQTQPSIVPTTNSTTAAFQKPSAPGTIEDDHPFGTVPTVSQIRPMSRGKNTVQVIDLEPAVEMSTRRNNPGSKKMDAKQLAQTYRLSDDVLKSYQEAFRIFDRNNDGCITCVELGTVMKSLGNQPSESELQDMINEVDVDGSGTIEFDEFVQMMSRRVEQKSEDDGEGELKEAFEVFDRNKDGCITADELRQVMRSLGENLTDQELAEMMKAADVNGDGIINFNEFQEVWTEARQLVMK